MTEADNMDCLQQLASEVTTWEEFIKEQDIDITKDLKREPDEDEDSSQKLPRSDVALYGIYPKIDGRVLSICVGCKGVFHPQHIKEHTCTNRNKTTIPQSLKKKVKNKKKSQASPLPPPPIFQEEPVSPSTSATTSEVPLITELDKIPSTIDPFETEPVVSTTVPAQIIATTVEIGPSSPIIVTTTSSTTATVTTTTCNDETIPTTTSSETIASSNETTINTGNTTYTSNGSSNSSSSSSSSKHKKAKRAKIPKEYNADVHCGVIDSKGICMRSITCSNHRIQQRKLVAGRTKDIHQLIADKKAAKEKDENSVEDEKEPDRQDNSYVPLLTTATNDKEVAKNSNTHIPVLPKTTENDPVQQTTSSSSSAPTAVLHMEVPTEANLSELAKSDDGYHSSNNSSTQEAASSPHVPVVYMPMSPVSVVSPVQLVQIGNNMVCIESPQPALSPPLPSQSFLWKIPDPIPSVKVYKTHPKPAALPTFGAKKIGGAVLLSNHRLECQYNDIQVAVATRRKASNNAINYKAVSLLNNTPHRPNILKVKNKNCKRPSTDKLITSESKQIRLAPDVNGFILHSDMSEGAEAPQANNSIQEKIALLNMK